MITNNSFFSKFLLIKSREVTFNEGHESLSKLDPEGPITAVPNLLDFSHVGTPELLQEVCRCTCSSSTICKLTQYVVHRYSHNCFGNVSRCHCNKCHFKVLVNSNSFFFSLKNFFWLDNASHGLKNRNIKIHSENFHSYPIPICLF